MYTLTAFAVLALFPVFGTYWGWRNIVIPYLWPCIKFGFAASRVLWWVGFVWFVVSLNPFTYHVWGRTPLNGWIADFMEYDRNVTPEGGWEPGWQTVCEEGPRNVPLAGYSQCTSYFGHQMRCRDRDFCADYRAGKKLPDHIWPTWTIIVPPIVIAAFVAYRRNVNRRRSAALVGHGPSEEENAAFFETLRWVNRAYGKASRPPSETGSKTG